MIVTTFNSDKLNSILAYPENANNNLPLLIYLHGAGERGTNLEHVYRHGVAELISKGKEINAYVLCPQCPANFVWSNIVADVKEFIDCFVKEYNIKPDRICLTGSSMGGFGAWSMAINYGGFFSAIAPVAGGEMSWRAPNLKGTPIRAYHGVDDLIVPIVYSRLMVDKAKALGFDCELIELPGLEHNSGIDYTYQNTDIIDWLLSKRRTDFSVVPEYLSEMF